MASRAGALAPGGGNPAHSGAGVEALLAQARDSADAERAEDALRRPALREQGDGGGAHWGALGASDVLDAAVQALRRHARDESAQLASVRLLQCIMQQQPVQSAAGEETLHDLTPSSLRTRAVRPGSERSGAPQKPYRSSWRQRGSRTAPARPCPPAADPAPERHDASNAVASVHGN